MATTNEGSSDCLTDYEYLELSEVDEVENEQRSSKFQTVGGEFVNIVLRQLS
jgi:hypothetical protein